MAGKDTVRRALRAGSLPAVAPLEELKRRLGEISDLGRIGALLGWDQNVMMPPGGAAARSAQMATLTRVFHERATDPELGRLLEELEPVEGELDPESDDAGLIRAARRDFEKNVRVPGDLRAEMARAGSDAYLAWAQAREEDDFASFLPHLELALELKHRYVECFDPADEPYDVLLDDFEPEMKTAEVRAVFEELKAGLVPLIAATRDAEPVDGEVWEQHFPVEGRQRFERAILDRFGFDPQAWRLDPTVHPFATGTAITDIRITTRYEETGLHSIFSSMHEFGHGLYEHSVSPSFDRTPLARGASLGFHESQSRMWENLVGRSKPFWNRFFPELQSTFPDQLGSVDTDAWYRIVNRVEPGLIRVDADEATYNLHIILRFELEQDLLAGTVPLAELPTIWNERMEEYLGVEVPNDRLGVLQDVHWSKGALGYFPTYALGNVISAQLWERIVAELPSLEEQIAAAEFGELRDWLRENLHRHGRKFMPRQLLDRLVGVGLDPQPLLRYLGSKLGDVYGIPVAG